MNSDRKFLLVLSIDKFYGGYGVTNLYNTNLYLPILFIFFNFYLI